MKKFIATALSILVGAFGYTIVDSTVEDRISSLESEVYELKQEISRYHKGTSSNMGIESTTRASTDLDDATYPDYSDTQSGLNYKDLIDENGVQVAGYKYCDDGYYYIDDKECWEEDSGYNEVYDNMAPMTAMFIDQVRVKFNYGGKDWMVQFWKGQYGWLLVGGEIGLYSKESSADGNYNDVNHYNCVDQEDWLKMSMDIYWAEGNNGNYKKVLSRPYDNYWWATGFVKGQLTKYTWPRSELKARNRITFKDAEMANAFVAELQKAGFTVSTGDSPDALSDDTYYQNGADVWILWHSIYQDCFK